MKARAGMPLVSALPHMFEATLGGGFTAKGGVAGGPEGYMIMVG